MDLVALMQQEIQAKNIKKLEEIKDYLYERSGQIFTFDPKSAFGTDEEKQELDAERIDIRNVQKFSLNCFSWAYAFVDLLHSFGIPAKVIIFRKEVEKVGGEKQIKEHAGVDAYINGETYFLDLMACFEDLIRIKFNFEPRYNIQITNNHPYANQIKEKKKGRSLENFLEIAKEKLKDLGSSSAEDYNYRVFKFIEGFMNSKIWGINVDYMTGMQFISKLMLEFLGRKDRPHNTHFVNNENGFYAEIYTLEKNGTNCYFAYQEVEPGKYELHEVDESIVFELKEKCQFIKGYNLSLKK